MNLKKLEGKSYFASVFLDLFDAIHFGNFFQFHHLRIVFSQANSGLVFLSDPVAQKLVHRILLKKSNTTKNTIFNFSTKPKK